MPVQDFRASDGWLELEVFCFFLYLLIGKIRLRIVFISVLEEKKKLHYKLNITYVARETCVTLSVIVKKMHFCIHSTEI